MNRELNDYIRVRYDRWLDYVLYHCRNTSFEGEEIDILNEVLLSLLQNEEKFLMKLYNAKKGSYREIDFFVLKMLKLNITSPTAPYRNKYREIPSDKDADLSRIDIQDEMYDEDTKDSSEYILEKMQQIRAILNELDLSPKARRIFEYHFFEGESFSDWPGKEDMKELYQTYNGIIELIKAKINNRLIF